MALWIAFWTRTPTPLHPITPMQFKLQQIPFLMSAQSTLKLILVISKYYSLLHLIQSSGNVTRLTLRRFSNHSKIIISKHNKMLEKKSKNRKYCLDSCLFGLKIDPWTWLEVDLFGSRSIQAQNQSVCCMFLQVGFLQLQKQPCSVGNFKAHPP